ncbi:hypothetical protein IMG5_117210 [Ichthyophthirius multifiliis]|uniref:NADP-dependent oxidoreductase domain-containing protein n=1 Tax=Ichthyophthirius multifiliis TaxID=5932 RepID=G0QUH7_ICHMU|nr:hypothetical protein IMG5_117210 [Ichthyophthirius multifiliis]EGR31128.1 hypothetical protein IMG5_117210 [Ichthyophthirius multifiliis]|eukprot:XP_004034614.1 hypothetical protein IMG5_117210 [Ichthyophthirius multifiliis]
MSNLKVPQRPLGSQGLVVSAQGLGCMGMTAFYGSFNRSQTEGESLKTIATALEHGINFLDTAWIYQSFGQGGGENYTNEELIGKAIKIHGRDKFIIATKFGILKDQNGVTKFSGKEETIRSQLADSLQRLGTNYIDLYYYHRIDTQTPIEETMEVLKKLILEGKIKYIGLSECTPDELRRAHKIHPITAIQMEWSLHIRDIEKDVVPTARELGVGIVAYSPLGRGLLSKTFDSAQDIQQGDSRNIHPRFNAENLEKNIPKKFFEKAVELGFTPAQLALAWVHSRGNDVFPIPGTKTSSRQVENTQAVNIQLSQQQWEEIEKLVDPAFGDRYPDMNYAYNKRLQS